jgi:hypothetical protein
MSDLCFEVPPDEQPTDFEEWVDLMYERTGLCYCNLCKALKINGYRESTDDV